MDRILHVVFNGAFNLVKAPLCLFLMLCIVVSLVRQQHRQRIAPLRQPARVR
jgi:hypothetical protein